MMRYHGNTANYNSTKKIEFFTISENSVVYNKHGEIVTHFNIEAIKILI